MDTTTVTSIPNSAGGAPFIVDNDTGVIAAQPAQTIRDAIPAEPMPDAVKLTTVTGQTLTLAISMPVTTVEEYRFAAEELAEIKAAMNSLEAKRLKVAGPLHKAWTALNAMFKGPMDTLVAAETALKTKMIAFDREQERLRREAEARQRALAQAEQDRIKREADAADLAARQAAEKLEKEAQAQRDDAARLAAAAARATAEGNAAAAAAATEAAATATAAANVATAASAEIAIAASVESSIRETIAIAAVQAATSAVVIPEAAKVKGISKRTKWVGVVENHAAALSFISAHPEYHALLVFDQTKLDKLVDAQRDGFAIDGIKATQNFSLGSRAA